MTAVLGASQEFANKKVTESADNVAFYIFSELERKDNVPLYFLGIVQQRRQDSWNKQPVS